MKVAFLDRDGVVNKDTGYVYKVEDFTFVDGCIDALKTFQEKEYKIIIVTNQSGIGRGYYTEADHQKLTHWYCRQLLDQGVTVTDVFHCPHMPDDHCGCRKPKNGLFLQAAEKYAIDFSNSFMAGDKLSDLKAGHAAGLSCLVSVNKNGVALAQSDVLDVDSLSDPLLSKKIQRFSSLLEFSKTL